ncbi:MAG: hypothetical protein K2I10_11840 [Lachnospiraceae bacterium]|nr:hypothetical protein [Lachnospiraceae bacterium]
MKKRIAWMMTILGIVGGALLGGALRKRDAQGQNEKIEKFKEYYNLLNQWLMIKQQGKNLEDYFRNHAYYKIAIYGMGELGNRLYDELKNTQVRVVYAIDQSANQICVDLPICMKDDLDKPEVDAIIVSAVFAFDEIRESLAENYDVPIISLDDVIYEI